VNALSLVFLLVATAAVFIAIRRFSPAGIAGRMERLMHSGL